MLNETFPPDRLAAELHQLHSDYVRRLNAAVEQDREDLAPELADLYSEEALGLLSHAR